MDRFDKAQAAAFDLMWMCSGGKSSRTFKAEGKTYKMTLEEVKLSEQILIRPQKRQKGAVKISNQRMKTSMIFIMLRKRSLLFLGFLNKQKDCLLLT
ncbi:TPA: hypothetical protein ACQDGA_001466 [Streptococcus pyogenes]